MGLLVMFPCVPVGAQIGRDSTGRRKMPLPQVGLELPGGGGRVGPCHDAHIQAVFSKK